MAGKARDARDNVDAEMMKMSEQIRSLDFISVIRRMECLYPDKPKLAESVRVADEMMRLSQHVSLAFQGPALHSLNRNQSKHAYRLYCNFFGLLGSNGPMPLHFTEYADQRTRHRSDPTFQEFLDFFNHRMLSLFYRAIAQFDPVINFDRPVSNEYDIFVGALGGYAHKSSQQRDTVSDHAKRYYAAWMGGKSKSPDGIKALVTDYFNIKSDVTEFVGGWLQLPENAKARLGGSSGTARLGISLYIGSRVWSIGHKFRVTIGPLSWDDYLSFKPGGARARELYQMVRNYVGDEWDWELQMLVRKTRVQPLMLNRKNSLGFTSWLAGSRASQLSEKSIILNHSVLH